MKALTFLLDLQEPVLATQPHSGEPNSAVSFPFIPGSMLRGALISAYLRDKQAENLLEDQKAWELFFGDSVFFLNAYLAYPQTQERMLPTPRSLFAAKDEASSDRATLYDFSVEIDSAVEQPKPPLHGDFSHISDGTTSLTNPTMQMNVHNASENRNRKREGESQVYRYEALAAGQALAGVILAREKDHLESLQSLLEDKLIMLGGSHTGGYGRVAISDLRIKSDWKEYQAEPALNDSVIITLLSDAILRDEQHGNITASFFQALGINRPIQDERYRTFYDVGLVGGFNRKWGLPLPQSWAIKAGSVFRLPSADLDEGKLEELIEMGVGYRRNEGFGRLAINWHTQATRTRLPLPSIQVFPAEQLSQRSKELAGQMAIRRLRTDLERSLVRAITRYRGKFQNLPSPSQLSRVRLAARQALLKEDAQFIPNHMDALTGAKTDWQAAKIDGTSLFEWVKQTSQLSEKRFIEVFELSEGLPQIGGVEAQLGPTLRTEYCARLVDGVMKLATEEIKLEKVEV